MIKRTPLVEFQTALYHLLKSYNAPVFDEIPDLTEFPRIEIGAYTGDPRGSKVEGAQEVTCNLNVYSRQEGKAETNDYLNAIAALIGVSKPPQDLNGFVFLEWWVGFFEVFRLEGEDGSFCFYQGVLRVHAKVQDRGGVKVTLPWSK